MMRNRTLRSVRMISNRKKAIIGQPTLVMSEELLTAAARSAGSPCPAPPPVSAIRASSRPPPPTSSPRTVLPSAYSAGRGASASPGRLVTPRTLGATQPEQRRGVGWGCAEPDGPYRGVGLDL